MTGPKGNTQFYFPEIVNVLWGNCNKGLKSSKGLKIAQFLMSASYDSNLYDVFWAGHKGSVNAVIKGWRGNLS